MNIKMKLFYGNNKYLLFFKSGAIFIAIKNNNEYCVTRLSQKPTYILDISTIDNFAASRNLKKVLELSEDSIITWYNNFESLKDIIKNDLNLIKIAIYNQMRYKQITDPQLPDIYSSLNVTDNKII